MGVDSPMTFLKPPPIRTALEELDRLGFQVYRSGQVWNPATRQNDIGWTFDWNVQVDPGMPRPRYFTARDHPKRCATLEEAAEALLEPRPGYYIHRVGKMRS